MHFIDEATIEVRAGDGGKGCVAFLREKHRPHGGPCGGNGGDGGDVVITADHNLSTLLDLRYLPRIEAKRGEHGRGKDQHGKGGEAYTLRVPLGTLVFNEETGECLADLTDHGQSFVVARGGRGGRGNMTFVTATRQAPDYAEPGEEGEERRLRFELKLLADVGVIGFPNAGKSTLISRVSRATPKIADYPFTTLTPNLGVVAPPGRTSFVMADVPGLIEGAHQGHGLGIRFLRHVERTHVFLHLLDASNQDEGRDPLKDFAILQNELECYDRDTGSDLAKRSMVVALNKVEDPEMAAIYQAEYGPVFERKKIPFFVISAHAGHGLLPMLHTLCDLLEKAKAPAVESADLGWDPLAP